MDFFPGATSLFKRVIHKKVRNSVIWWSGICFFKGLRLLFFHNVPGATFIQGATLIPESRVPRKIIGLYECDFKKSFGPIVHSYENNLVFHLYKKKLKTRRLPLSYQSYYIFLSFQWNSWLNLNRGNIFDRKSTRSYKLLF